MDHRARRRASTLDRLLLALAAVVLLVFAVGVRNHRTTSSFALLLAAVAVLLALLAFLLPLLTRPARPRRADVELRYAPAPPGPADPGAPPGAVDAAYAVVALEDGWPPSRLLGHAVVPRLVGGTSWLVVTADGRPLGVVAADDLRQRFAPTYPALEAALAAAWDDADRAAPRPTLAKALYAELLERLPGSEPPLTPAELTAVLGDALDTRSVRRRRSPARQLADVLSVDADRVVVVGPDGRLVGLVDRRAVLEELARQSTSASGAREAAPTP